MTKEEKSKKIDEWLKFLLDDRFITWNAGNFSNAQKRSIVKKQLLEIMSDEQQD